MTKRTTKRVKTKTTARTASGAAGRTADTGHVEPDSSRFSGPEQVLRFADSVAEQAAAAEPAARPVRMETWVAFELGDETFALPVADTVEILRVDRITAVPHAPTVVRGITNMRGRVLPVIDLRRRLRLAPRDIDARSRILVTEQESRMIGLLVDAMWQVVRLDRNSVVDPPGDVMTDNSEYIVGVHQGEDRLVILLDTARVVLVTDPQLAGQHNREVA